MQRHHVAAGLAGTSALALAAGHLIDLVPGTFPTTLSVVLSFGGLAILVGLPLVGALLVARRRGEGVALLVTLALVAVPAVATGVYFLGLGAGDRRGSLVTLAVVVGHAAMVAAGVVAWTLRDPADWRWEHRPRVAYLVLAAGVLVPEVTVFSQAFGWSSLLAVVFVGGWLAFAQLATLLIAAVLLILAARLPRPVAGVVLLGFLLPRLHQSVLPLAWTSGHAGLAMSGIDGIGLGAEVALTATALWWLGRGRPRAGLNATTPVAPSIG